MTNKELETTLREMIKSGTMDKETVGILQDASIHAAMHVGLELQTASGAYTAMAMLHQILLDVVGLEHIEAEEFKDEPLQPATPAEKEQLHRILGDLNIDL